MRRSLDRVPAWPAVVACMAAIFAASSIPLRGAAALPKSVPAGPVRVPTDKVGHLAEFGVLAFLMTRALRSDDAAVPVARAVIAAVAGATVFGALDELHQRSVAGRTAAW